MGRSDTRRSRRPRPSRGPTVTNPSASGGSYAISDARGGVHEAAVPGDGGVAPHPARPGDGSSGDLGGRSPRARRGSLLAGDGVRDRAARGRDWSTDRTPPGSSWSGTHRAASSGNSGRDRPLARGLAPQSVDAIDLERAPHGRGLFVRGVAREPHRRSRASARVGPAARPLGVAKVTSARSPRRSERSRVTASMRSRPRWSRSARSAACTWGRIARPTAIAVESSRSAPRVPARDLGSLAPARRGRSTARGGRPRGCRRTGRRRHGCSPRCASGKEAASRSATGRPRSAQHGSRRPWVQTTKSGSRRSSVNDGAIARIQLERVSRSWSSGGEPEPCVARVDREARARCRRRIRAPGGVCGSAGRARRSGARGLGARVRAPCGRRASRSPSRPHGAGVLDQQPMPDRRRRAGEGLIRRQAPQRAAIAGRGVDTPGLSVRRGS